MTDEVNSNSRLKRLEVQRAPRPHETNTENPVDFPAHDARLEAETRDDFDHEERWAYEDWNPSEQYDDDPSPYLGTYSEE